ncbi:hexosaminidase D-like isoform X2 [Tiliqua scincoides]|uniref:hexosaminidase D-like isoform X2 n=1 Tax=Tiliqua scincoides TaxID=71010 RepID=UPI0034627B96
MALHRSQKLNLLRLLVLLTVTLAGIKFFFRGSFSLDQQKDPNRESSFWGKPGEPKESAKPQDRSLGHQDTKALAPKPEMRKDPLRDFSATQMRLVHLDLKGAPPKVSYLEQVFPLFSKLGANGVLIEYEDMFPFTGELEILKSPNAYSEEDIDKIQELAELNNLEVVPLVQTFGHVEVFHLGEGLDSKNWMSRNGGDVGKMYLSHIREVVNFVASRAGGQQVLLWDDMLRKISLTTIQDSGIAKHASPMLWVYSSDFDTQQIGKYIAKYAECGFKTIWFASAFKGTSGPAQAWTPLQGHLQNHLRWLKVIQSMAATPSIRYQGIVLTGWQRYDHYSVLCELLPVGIPSLAVCLQTLVNGGFTDATRKKVLDMLGFQSMQLEKSTCEGNGAFPGSDIYRMVEQVNDQLKDSVVKVLEQESSIKGWFSPYHRKHLFGNPRNMESFGSKVLKVHENWETFIQTLRSHMDSIYFSDTVEEWMEENVNPHMDRLREFVRDFKEILRLNARPKTL